MVDLSLDEAEAVARKAIELTQDAAFVATGDRGRSFDEHDPHLMAQAVAGTLRIVEALQVLGYTVERPGHLQ
jgi:hypothetical protein